MRRSARGDRGYLQESSERLRAFCSRISAAACAGLRRVAGELEKPAEQSLVGLNAIS